MNTIILLDVAAVFVLSIIFITNIYRKMYKDMASLVFLALIGTTLIAALSESMIPIIYAMGCRVDGVFMAIKTLYIFTHFLATPVYFLYVISITSND